MAVRYYVGTSGWRYDHWRELFYPVKLARAKWLELFYTGKFSTVELNSSFYRLPSENAFTGWHDASPPGFIFAVKVSRFITHIKRLIDAEDAVNTFISRAGILGDKPGPLLYQLPPDMTRDDSRPRYFLSILPRGAETCI